MPPTLTTYTPKGINYFVSQLAIAAHAAQVLQRLNNAPAGPAAAT
jgi:hypothetical protein